MEQDKIWRETFTIDASMVDQQLEATPVAICNLMQIIAGNHADFHDLGFDGMLAQQRMWVLNRLSLRMLAYPQWRSKITLQTWIQTMRGPFSYRNFEVFDESGNSIGTASTLWVALNTETRKPTRWQLDTSQLPILTHKTVPHGNAEKISTPLNTTIFKETIHKVVYSDLDLLGHTNNVKYIEWIFNNYAPKELINKPLYINLNFLKETHFEEQIKIQSYQINSENNLANKQHYHELRVHSSNELTLKAIIH